MNVLIVDDNAAAADLLQELVSLEQQHMAQCAYTARQAIEAFGQSPFDIALIDLSLPDQPGTEVARQLRAAAAGRPLTLVAVSGFAQDDPAGQEALALFDHYLQKPIDFSTLDRLLVPPAAP